MTSPGYVRLLSNVTTVMQNTAKLWALGLGYRLVFTAAYVDKQDCNYLPRIKLRLICQGLFLVV